DGRGFPSGDADLLPDGGTPVNRCAEVPDAGSKGNVGSGLPGAPPCNGDYASAATAPCPTRERGYCSTQGQCSSCGDCTLPPGHDGPQCSRLEGLCGASCLAFDGGCASDRYCDFIPNQFGACIPKRKNGEVASVEALTFGNLFQDA